MVLSDLLSSPAPVSQAQQLVPHLIILIIIIEALLSMLLAKLLLKLLSVP